MKNGDKFVINQPSAGDQNAHALALLVIATSGEGPSITPTLVSPPVVENLTFNTDVSFSYAFPPDLVGPVKFTWQVSVPVVRPVRSG